ncbi:L,D-transpeptidase family protein [Pedobacter aquatilis]|uniref:L,D-transpeptidase family protein n=1 Tax=Pedobacter aquatilis TaxID=351343 RepID=UPI0025B61AE9|nr:L,D-transpeptidase family protein [Pedobacter aquatilis]MDN3588439.1 L,D-transpeptidase family protein [Pedobacter aquatilis]
MKTFTTIFFPAALIYFFIFHGSKHSTGELLAESLGQEIYKDFDSVKYDSVFINEFKSLSMQNENLSSLKAHFKNNVTPNFTIRFFGVKGLDSLITYLDKGFMHGFNSETFRTKELKNLIVTLKANNFTNVDESYSKLAKLEILSSYAFIKYAGYLKFGVVNPKKIYLRYNIDVKQADSLFIRNMLSAVNIVDTLNAIQNKSNQYVALQKAYLNSKNDSLKKILAINMERLRWVLPLKGEKYIQVNIPDFRLVYFNGEDTLTTMKVCVGERRDADYDKKLKIYEKTGDLDDKPNNRETPQLYSNIKYIYSNPEWNIPESIAQTEIYTMARRNSNYLRRHNILVYHKNKLIENPSNIRWYKYDRKKLPFLFVQQSGSGNSLGKLKFIFPNTSSVYLHDTNVKSAFKLNNRAISHGCIRLEKPLQLAWHIMANETSFEKVRTELGLKPLIMPVEKKNANVKKDIAEKLQLKPMRFLLDNETPLLITYHTAWAKNGKIEYRKDVYEMDEKLWNAMKIIR